MTAPQARAKRRGGRPWRRLRANVLQRDGWRCQLAYPGIRATQVDHRQLVTEHPELEFDPSNCRAVCEPCHRHRTHAGDTAPIAPSRNWTGTPTVAGDPACPSCGRTNPNPDHYTHGYCDNCRTFTTSCTACREGES